MAIKTKEEMFGDGAGFGAAVPYSTSNPAGYGAGNRGIGFGEQLTSAIANRTHYALALNDEDLDARLGVFETDGLDAAYRLGATATAGGGRIITLDGAAVETRSVLAAEYANDIANAHFRANALGDTLRGSAGFEFLSDNDPEDVSAGTGWAGFLDRRAVAFQPAGFSSYFTGSENVTLNPGGAGGAIVRLSTGGRKFWTAAAGPTPPAGNYTALRLGVDLIQISGTASDDGLYIIDTLGASGTDVTVRTLNGAEAAFTSGATGTATVFRVRLGSIGTEWSGSRTGLRATVLSSPKGGGSALDLFAGGEGGFGDALRVRYARRDGGIRTGMSLDEYGRMTFDVLSADLRVDFSAGIAVRHARGGAFATRVERQLSEDTSGEFAHLVTASDTSVVGRYDFTSNIPFVPTGVTNLDTSIPFSFVANSPTDGQLDLSGASLAASTWEHLLPYGMLVEIVTGSGDTPGYYLLTQFNGGSEYVRVRELNVGTPSHFPTSGAGTLRFHACSRLGGGATTLDNAFLALGTATLGRITPYNVLVGGAEADSVALTVMTPGNPLGTESRAAIRAYTNLSGASTPLEIFAVKPGGPSDLGYVEAHTFYAHRAVYLDEVGGDQAEILYGAPGGLTPRTRTLRVNLSRAISEESGTSEKWELSTGTGVSTHFLRSLVNNGYCYLPINDMLRTGMEITGLRMRVNLNGSAHPTQGDQLFAGMFYVAVSMSATAAATPQVVGSVNVGNVTGWQTVDPGATISGGAHTVDLSARDYFIYLKASVDGASNADEVHAIELIVDDPGPRNF